MSVHYADPASGVILWGTLILIFGIIGRYLANLINQPSVLGELLMGIVIGNICYFWGLPLAIVLREGGAVFSIMHDFMSSAPLTEAVSSIMHNPSKADQLLRVLNSPQGNELVRITYVLDVFARYGVIFLLFVVGLDSSLDDLKQTGRSAIYVAVLGIMAPLALGLITLYMLMPDLPLTSALFVAATLSATSVGITARVLKELKQLKTREAKTIMGAAMIDDILGLILLAVVSGLVISGHVELWLLVRILFWAGIFFVGVLWLCPVILRLAVAGSHFLDPWETKLFTAFILVMFLSWLANLVHLASIIGAFLAGIIMHEGLFRAREERNTLTIKQLVMPFEAVFAPLFFMLVGIQVKLEAFFNWHVVMIAIGLTVAAIAGKLLCGLGGARKDDRFLIGIGMLPRGEVGLIFAFTGQGLGIIPDSLFASIILMVMVTTLITPAWLKSRFSANSTNGN